MLLHNMLVNYLKNELGINSYIGPPHVADEFGNPYVTYKVYYYLPPNEPFSEEIDEELTQHLMDKMPPHTHIAVIIWRKIPELNYDQEEGRWDLSCRCTIYNQDPYLQAPQGGEHGAQEGFNEDIVPHAAIPAPWGDNPFPKIPKLPKKDPTKVGPIFVVGI